MLSYFSKNECFNVRNFACPLEKRQQIAAITRKINPEKEPIIAYKCCCIHVAWERTFLALRKDLKASLKVGPTVMAVLFVYFCSTSPNIRGSA